MMTLFKKLLLLTLTTTLALYAQPATNEQILASSGGDAVAMTSEYAIVGDADAKKVNFYKLDYSDFQWKTDGHFQGSHFNGNLGFSVAIDGNIAVAGSPLHSHSRIFRFQGNNTAVFQEYKIGTDSWVDLAAFAGGPVNDGGALTHAGNFIYGFQGGNNAFYAYDIANNSWSQLANTPTDLDAGAAMVYNNDTTNPHLYALRGNGTTDFWKYDINANTWSTGSPMPGAIGYGGSIVIGTSNLAYALRDNGSTDFYVADATATSWVALPTSVPEDVGAGGALAYNGGNFYILIGNNTPRLYAYNRGFNAWYPRTDAPGNVGAGGSMVFDGTAMYVQQGGGADGYWRFDPERNDWTVLTPSTELTGGGGALSMQLQPAGEGVVDVYERNAAEWKRKLRISLATPVTGDHFGHSVGIRNNNDGTAKIVVGAPGKTEPGNNTGAVFIYDYTTAATGNIALNASNSIELVNSASLSTDRFGTSVDIKGDNLAVGAPFAEDGAGGIGAMLLYKDNGDVKGFVVGSLANDNVNLGRRVAISRDGNTSMASSDNAFTTLYEESTSSVWTLKLNKNNTYGAGVDIDNGVFALGKDSQLHGGPENRIQFAYDLNDNKAKLVLKKNDVRMHSLSLYYNQSMVSDSSHNNALAIDVPCGIKPTHLIANEWAMISVPCGDGSATVSEIFGDDMVAVGAGIYCPDDNPATICGWVMYKDGLNYTGTSADNVRVGANDAMVLGQGYWIIADHNVTLKVDDTAVTTRTALTQLIANSATAGFYDFPFPAIATTDNPKKIMVGNPFPRKFDWINARLVVGPSDEPIGHLGITETVAYVYDETQAGQPYRAINYTPGFPDVINSYQGFWIRYNPAYDFGSGVVKIRFPFEK